MPRKFADTLFSPAALARFFLIAVLGLTADIWTKSLAVSQLSGAQTDEMVRGVFGDCRLNEPYETFVKTHERHDVHFINGWLDFTFTQNPGAVFGLAPGKRMVFLIVSVLAVLFLTYLFSGSSKRIFYQIILGMLMAGVLGNMYDRITVGEVRDMVQMLPGWHWPAGVRHVLPFLPREGVFPYIFNVADSLLCVGVGLMLIYSFFNAPDEAPNEAVGKKPREAAAKA